LGMIAPRADMLQNIQVGSGNSVSFYFTLKSQNLQVEDENSITNAPILEDGNLVLNGGVSLRRYPFPRQVDNHRGFQGKIHYRALQECSNLPVVTELHFGFATEANVDIRDANEALTSGIMEWLRDDPQFSRWARLHGLSLSQVVPTSLGNRSK